MHVSLRTFGAAAALVALTATASFASVSEGAVLRARVYNDAPNATLQASVGGSTASFSETGVSAPTGFANRDDFLLSTDNANPQGFDATSYFDLTADLTLTGNPAGPRKEAGLRVNNSVGDPLSLIVNTDGHEVVAFGGGVFYDFRAHGAANFNSGDTVSLGIRYLQQGGLNGYILTAGGVTSNFLAIGNNEGGIAGPANGNPLSTVGGYFQIQNDSANPGNSGSAVFSNIKYGLDARSLAPINATPNAVPEPGSLALLGTGLLPLAGVIRRRRK